VLFTDIKNNYVTNAKKGSFFDKKIETQIGPTKLHFTQEIKMFVLAKRILLKQIIAEQKQNS